MKVSYNSAFPSGGFSGFCYNLASFFGLTAFSYGFSR